MWTGKVAGESGREWKRVQSLPPTPNAQAKLEGLSGVSLSKRTASDDKAAPALNY